MKQNIQGAMEIIYSVRDLVRVAIQSVPQTSIVWTGVCFALEVNIAQTVSS